MFIFTNEFMSDEKNVDFLRSTMMGPNALRVTEELVSRLNISEKMRILDLGCGNGLSTFLLAKKYGASVFAADLWISPTENYERFQSLTIDDKACPVFADATKGLPFANRYFDCLISVDAYHYFGYTEEMLPSLTPFVKQGGHIAVAIPGLKHEFGKDVPEEMRPFWCSEMETSFHSLDWWKNLWQRTECIEIIECCEMVSNKQAWDEWLAGYHPMIVEDIKMIEAEGGRYFNLIQLIAKVI
ncbi:MAG: SAM-dependent methyltransferase [Thermoguttaceae bacterium]